MPLTEKALGEILTEARSQNRWLDKSVPASMFQRLYEVVKFGPTSGNCTPARFLFLHTSQAKRRLEPAISGGNLEKTMNSAVSVVVAHDPLFYEKLPYLFPHNDDARSWFTSSKPLAEETAFRNGSLQGAYLIIAARALGLDAGPISGFDNAMVDEEFFAGSGWKSNFIVNLGFGDSDGLFPRLPRLAFEEACVVL